MPTLISSNNTKNSSNGNCNDSANSTASPPAHPTTSLTTTECITAIYSTARTPKKRNRERRTKGKSTPATPKNRERKSRNSTKWRRRSSWSRGMMRRRLMRRREGIWRKSSKTINRKLCTTGWPRRMLLIIGRIMLGSHPFIGSSMRSLWRNFLRDFLRLMNIQKYQSPLSTPYNSTRKINPNTST